MRGVRQGSDVSKAGAWVTDQSQVGARDDNRGFGGGGGTLHETRLDSSLL